MPKGKGAASSSDSSDDEDLSKFASCAVTADALQEHAVKEKRQREYGAAKRAKARGGHAHDDSKGASEHELGVKEDDGMDPISMKIAKALAQKIENGGFRVQDQSTSQRKDETSLGKMNEEDDTGGVRLFKRVKRGQAVVLDVPRQELVQEKTWGVSAKERCLGARYQMPSDQEKINSVISILGDLGEKIKVKVDEGIRERKKKRRMEAELQRAFAAEAKTGEEEKKRKKKKQKVEGEVLDGGRPFVQHTDRIRALIGH